jgi:tRNA modification GTPase
MHRRVAGSSLANPLDVAQDRQVLAGETVAAISTPAGEGAIALVRMSGIDAIAVADKIFRGQTKPSQFAPHVQHFGHLVDEKDQAVDEVMMSIHRTPASYTGEDLVEISCHGGVLVTAKVLESCLRAGARAAHAGEFTERAFRNGKMDLTQAEAVIDVIRAKTDLALRSATEQLEGRLGDAIREIRDGLIATIANIEASIDFSEEGIAPAEGEQLRAHLDSLREKMSILLSTADHGRILREGVRVVIYGATNAGKSSLLNRLVGFDRVIVSETPGTTRDTIEETISLRGIPIRLLDTAGLRPSVDEVERAGMARTEKSLQTADLRLHIADGNAPRPADFDSSSANGADVVVINKSDLPEHADWKKIEGLRTSCVTGAGVTQLEEEILARMTKENLRPENAAAINARHRDCLRRALEACDRAGVALTNGIAPEYVAVDLNDALHAVGEVLGVVDVEQILDSVFSQFCIGK